ncbi:unnamed protein product [Protopolystoma xenopodis]|uniref:Small ribosomal subunit protein eS19 n=1 Tax=Protopolystoma xenopodis TaxID=117903 RepID=A0A3S5CMS9_9PLAT|nr:unnamed protein product [Protopolystoma xenopodis]
MKKKHVKLSVKDVSGHVFVRGLSQLLKKNAVVKPPDWVDVVKLNISNELGPYDPDWFYVRCAAILRHIYIRPTGMKGLTKAFSRRKRNGVRPSHRSLASQTVIRKALQQLENAGFVAKSKNGGRMITSEGYKQMDILAYEIHKAERLSS